MHAVTSPISTTVNTLKPAPELLCPAGDWDALKSAVANGADAVYFGLDAFNARRRAHNFSLEELPDVMTYLHRHNVRGFVTFNVLIFSGELENAAKYIAACVKAGVDALIVQDLGVVRLIREISPTMEIHGSTQMSLTEPRGIDFVRTLGVSRVVVARELSLADIGKITAATNMPLEVFIHGGLSVANSGQYLTGESVGIVKRDLGDIAHLMSPQDPAAYDLINQLTQLDVVSFKIEGRFKSANYVAATAQTYRQAIDAAAAGNSFTITREQRADLEQVFSRGLSEGFRSGVDHQKPVPRRSQNNRGRLVGTLAYTSFRTFVIDLDPAAADDILRPGDGIVFGDGVAFDDANPQQVERGGRVYHTKLDYRKQRLTIELGNNDARPDEVTPNSLVWKTDDPQMNKRLEQSWARDRVVHRVELELFVYAHAGQMPRIKATSDGVEIEVVGDAPLDPAERFPITQEHALRQFDKLKDTPFELVRVTLDTDGQAMLGNKIIDQLRRDVVIKLNDARHKRSIREVANLDAVASLRQQKNATAELEHPRLHVLARTMDQIKALIEHKDSISTIYVDFEDVRRYPAAVQLCSDAGVPVAVATMRIIKPGEESWLKEILLCKPDAVIVRNLAAIGFFKEHAPQLPLIGDFSLNVANELTAHVFMDAGISRMVASYDLNWTQMKGMIQHAGAKLFECVIHQHMPMFQTEDSVFAHTLSVSFKDQLGKAESPVLAESPVPDAGFGNTLFNAVAKSTKEYVPGMLEAGVRDFRIELLGQNKGEIGPLVARYVQVIGGAVAAK